MSTPKLSTAIRSRIERRDRQAQTTFPAKVTAWKSSDNTVELEPQFIETWVNRDGTRESEVGDAIIKNVPVCYPWHITWDITVGAFGLVICTKYSLDQWRQQLRRMDPGDLRRFTMSGATFHPVVIGEEPSTSASYDFVALKQDVIDIKDYLDEIKADFNAHVHMYTVAPAGPTATTTAPSATPPKQIVSTYTVQASGMTKVET
jgi:hypothetical protein